MFIDELFKENPLGWVIIICVVAVVIVLAIKFRFWLVILKLLVVLLVLIIVHFLVIPLVYDYIFDPQFIVDWFWRITPSPYDDFKNVIDFLVFVIESLLFLGLIKLATRGNKRASPSNKAKVRVEVS